MPTAEKRRVRLTHEELEKSLWSRAGGSEKPWGMWKKADRIGYVSLELLGCSVSQTGKRTGSGGPKLGRGSIKRCRLERSKEEPGLGRMEKGREEFLDNRV